MNIQFKKGVLELCVLSVLENKDCYGYELVNILLKQIDVKEGTIYPLLRRLKKDSLLSTYLKESPSGPPRKYYSITDSGRYLAKELKTEWLSFQKSINEIIKEDKNE